MTQCDKILFHLQTIGSITPVEALDQYGCFRLAARVADLKAEGWPITSEIVSKQNRFGETVRFAKYRLEDKRVTGN